MAFWGIEVKPEKPYIHRCNGDEGRLHLSQATLGTGESNKKTTVQCTVGRKKPIFLCRLLPDKLETCALNLEFEEDEDVTFSVIGPHTVHLSGFFLGEYGNEDESDADPFEVHYAQTESEPDDSFDYDSEDEDNDDFVDGDNLNMYPSPAARASGVKIEEIFDDEKPANKGGMPKQKEKKHTANKSADKNTLEKQIGVRSPQITMLESEDEDGFPLSSPREGNTDGLNNEETNRSKGEDAQREEDTVDIGHGKRSKRKIDAVGLDTEHSRGDGHAVDLTVKAIEVNDKNGTKHGKKAKKKKSTNEDEIAPETESKNLSSQDAILGNIEENVKKEKVKEKKKKKKKNSEQLDSSNTRETNVDKSESGVDEETKGEAKSSQVRSFSNGLVIEELAMGKPDGKKATPGKKVSVHYVGKLKKNGKIFDSNIGRAPFKFRLGIAQVIKGWDVGVNGMRVGDKRRLTIPPSMGYGAKGAGNAIPPNSWLVFEVELADVN